MYRVNKSCDESSSGDEGPSFRKGPRLDSADDTVKDCKAGSKAAQMWTDLLAEQSLAETFSDKVGVFRGENDMVKRGVESYVLPDVRCTSNDEGMKHQMNHKIIPAEDDNGPFDFIADEEKVARLSDKYERCPRKHGSGSKICSGRGSACFGDQKKNGRQSSKHFGSTSRGIRKRRRNNCDPNMKSAGRNIRGDLNSSSMSSSDYSLRALFTAEFSQNISIDELAGRIVSALGERNEKFLKSVILEIGKEKALELFEATRAVEASGGMMVADGTRRRTPGGVFITLFKTDPDVLPVLKEKVCNLQKAFAREIRTAKRRGKREMAKPFGIADENVEKLKKLPASSEVLLEDIEEKLSPM